MGRKEGREEMQKDSLPPFLLPHWAETKGDDGNIKKRRLFAKMGKSLFFFFILFFSHSLLEVDKSPTRKGKKGGGWSLRGQKRGGEERKKRRAKKAPFSPDGEE